jgi:murein DD-endopeptidase MepM/ murein hydrolase activator NlpD
LEFQFHPASGSGAVRSLVLGDRGQKAAIVLAGAAALAAVSLWVTVPAVVGRALASESEDAFAAQSSAEAAVFRGVQSRTAGLADRARDAGSLLSRIAFLYEVSPADWPAGLNPEAGLLAGADTERVAAGLPRYLAELERGRVLLSRREEADPDLARRTPSLLPVAGELVEPAVFFGPRISPWTGSEEFFTGLQLAAPAGSAVLAPADGTVVFTGKVAASMRSNRSRYGNLVVLSHGKAGYTLFGHLAKIEARRGQRVRRGARLGTVGTSRWTMSPSLHYELWRDRGSGLAPTDPRFGILDRRLGPPDLSLEKMAATSAPPPIDPLPAR